MTADVKRALVQRYFSEVLSQRNIAAADELLSPDIFYHGPLSITRGLSATKAWLTEWVTAFPDNEWTVDYTICDDERAMGRVVLRGTHRAEFRGVAPTGRRIALPSVLVFLFDGTKVTDIEAFYDGRVIFEQLGVALPPAQGFSQD